MTITWGWLLYALAWGCAVSVAALALEAAANAMRWPGRWIWLVAGLVTVGLPLRAALLPSSAGEGPPAVLDLRPPEARAPTEAQASAGTLPAAQLSGAPTSSRLRLLASKPVPGAGAVWLLASLSVLLAAAAGQGALSWKARRWRTDGPGGRTVLVSADVGPAVVGVLRPRVVLPSWALELDEASLEVVVRHEKAHVAAGDTRLLALFMLVVAAAPWIPWLWWQLRRLRASMESDCDRRAAGVDPAAYCRVLALVAARGRQAVRFAPVAGVAGSLERRVRLLLLPSRGRRGRALVGALGATALLAAACEMPLPPPALEDGPMADTSVVLVERKALQDALRAVAGREEARGWRGEVALRVWPAEGGEPRRVVVDATTPAHLPTGAVWAAVEVVDSLRLGSRDGGAPPRGWTPLRVVFRAGSVQLYLADESRSHSPDVASLRRHMNPGLFDAPGRLGDPVFGLARLSSTLP